MYKRRSFLKNSGAAALGSFILPGTVSAFFKEKVEMDAIGLQLFTLFSTIDDDVQGTLKKVAGIGYKEIESAFSKKGDYYGMKAKEFASMVKDNGMSWQSHHVLGAPFKLPKGTKMPTTADGKPMTMPPMRNLRDNYQEIVDELAEAGLPYLVCANTPIETAEEIKNSIAVLNKASEAAKKAGIVMAYHNHDAEFKAVDGKVPYDLLLSETNADALKMELDLCWVIKAGVDPVELFKKNPGRFPLWHVKDMDKDFKEQQSVGNGVIDFKRIFANAEIAGMKHFFIEQDFPSDAFATITVSINNLKKILA